MLAFETTESADIEIDFYYILYTISQIGGFMYFFRSVFGFILSIFSKNFLILEIANKQTEMKTKEEMRLSKMFKKNRSLEKLNIGKFEPNSETFLKSSIQSNF
jgi:hypothetical protein